MEKIKDWFNRNHAYLILALGTVTAVLLSFLGFEKGVQRGSKRKKEEEIKNLKLSVSNTIIKEKLADEKKSIHEISEDIDDILDRK